MIGRRRRDGCRGRRLRRTGRAGGRGFVRVARRRRGVRGRGGGGGVPAPAVPAADGAAGQLRALRVQLRGVPTRRFLGGGRARRGERDYDAKDGAETPADWRSLEQRGLITRAWL